MQTTTPSSERTAPPRSLGSALLTAPAIAGIVYVAAWVAGLAIWPSNIDVAASGREVIAAEAGHATVAMIQSLLVHGVAAVALAVVVLALGRAAGRSGESRWGLAVLVFGLAAVTVSLAQLVLGLLLGGWAVPGGDSGRVKLLFDLVDRLDGAKMLLLAATAASSAALAGRTAALPPWLGYLALLTALALVTSAAGYLVLSSALALAAAASLPLLLAWALAAGVVLGRGGR
jgi:hypothetical protein